MVRWIHITSWENGQLFDLSPSILSVLEIENVQAAALITTGKVCLNLLQHTNTCRIELALTKLSLQNVFN